jgi:hypothetical protein
MSWKISLLAAVLFILPVTVLHAQGGLFLKIGPKAVWKSDEKKLS